MTLDFRNPFVVLAIVLAALCLAQAILFAFERLRARIRFADKWTEHRDEGLLYGAVPAAEFLVYAVAGLGLVLLGVPLASSDIVLYQIAGTLVAGFGFQTLLWRLGVRTPLLATNYRSGRGGGGGRPLRDVDEDRDEVLQRLGELLEQEDEPTQPTTVDVPVKPRYPERRAD